MLVSVVSGVYSKGVIGVSSMCVISVSGDRYDGVFSKVYDEC